MSALNSLVSEAIDLVVHCVRTDKGPRIGSIVAVEDLAGTIDGTAFTATDVFVRDNLTVPFAGRGLYRPAWTKHSPQTDSTFVPFSTRRGQPL